MTKTILLTNYKGGVGKSTINSVFTYILAKRGKKVLAIDFDPQGHLQKTLETTFNIKKSPMQEFSKSILSGNLGNSIIKLTDNIDLIPADRGLSHFSESVANMNYKVRYNFLREGLEGIKDKYDYVIIDTPPTFDTIVYNSLVVADSVALVMQTEAHSRDSSIDATQELVELHDNLDCDFDFTGVILYLYHDAKVDRLVMQEAKDYFGDAVFKNIVETQERVNWWNYFGIHDEKYWDKRAMNMYGKVLDELLERIE